MSQALNQSWHVGKATATCSTCGVTLEPGKVCWAALCDRKPGVAPVAAPVEPDKKEKKARDKGEAEFVSPFERIDFCEACWAAGKRPSTVREDLEMFSFWRTTVPQPQQKKRLLVDDSVLVDLFARMSERNDLAEERFRFVLALILMRKRLLKYESTAAVGEGENAKEIWTMYLRGNEQPVLVTNPHLNADQITEVSQQLSSILAEEI